MNYTTKKIKGKPDFLKIFRFKQKNIEKHSIEAIFPNILEKSIISDLKKQKFMLDYYFQCPGSSEDRATAF